MTAPPKGEPRKSGKPKATERVDEETSNEIEEAKFLACGIVPRSPSWLLACGLGQVAALTVHRTVIHYRDLRFATPPGELSPKATERVDEETSNEIEKANPPLA